MTFLMPYALLDKGWNSKFRGFALFDLGTGLLIPFVIATGCLHGIGIVIGLIHRWPLGKMALRGAGAFITAMGIFFLWQALA